ncbi:MAG: leucine-rich repeat protein [Oscillospiraceae bacterium]|nr:leucine-rich repeat protein [Oscillospiraceae bacterium]
MKKIKKLFALLLCLVMAATLLPSSVLADEDEPELIDYGKYSKIEWGVYSDGTLVVVGDSISGTIKEPWSKYKDSITSIYLDVALGIPANFFHDFPNLEFVYISESVNNINLPNFTGCPNIYEYYVEEENPYYASDNFGVLLTKDMKTVVKAPTRITVYLVSETVKTIKPGAFAGCSNLMYLIFAGDFVIFSDDSFTGVTATGYYYAKYSRWESIYDFPLTTADITWYGILDEGLLGENLGWMLLTEGILHISGSGAIPDYAAEGDGASPFAGNEYIGYISLQGEITHIGKNAFNDCPNLSTLFFNNPDAPAMTDSFKNVRAVGLYPSTWKDTPKDHGGDILWVKYDAETGELLGTGIPGDVNVDGEISNADLILVARYVVNLIEEDSFQHEFVAAFGDMDGDEAIGNTDIITVARRIVGLD